MLITHAISHPKSNHIKSQTPKRKIKHISTVKNQPPILNNDNTKNNYIITNHQGDQNQYYQSLVNKENQNPNLNYQSKIQNLVKYPQQTFNKNISNEKLNKFSPVNQQIVNKSKQQRDHRIKSEQFMTGEGNRLSHANKYIQTENMKKMKDQNDKKHLQVHNHNPMINIPANGKQEIKPTSVKHSPLKKILFVKNMNFKSNKTSKNPSLDKKQNRDSPLSHNSNAVNYHSHYQDNKQKTIPLKENNYLSNLLQDQNHETKYQVKKQNNIQRCQSNEYGSLKSKKYFQQPPIKNQSNILNQQTIQGPKSHYLTKGAIDKFGKQLQNNKSQKYLREEINYRNKFQQKNIHQECQVMLKDQQINSKQAQSNKILQTPMSGNEIKSKSLGRVSKNFVQQKFTPLNSQVNQNLNNLLHQKNNFNSKNKACPNIQSSQLSSLQIFRNKHYLTHFSSFDENFTNKNQVFKQKVPYNQYLNMEKQRKEKESLSAKKRNSRLKVTFKQPQRDEQQNLSSNQYRNDSLVGDQNHYRFENNYLQDKSRGRQYSKNQQASSLKKQQFKYKNSLDFDSVNSKRLNQQSTLMLQTKSNFQDTFGSLNQQSVQFKNSKDLKINEAKQNKNFYIQDQVKINRNNSSTKDKNQNNSKNTKNKIKYCFNHPQKEAKFKIKLNNQQVQKNVSQQARLKIGLSFDDNKLYYCSKCTVLLVTKGYEVSQNLTQKCSRMEIINQFLSNLDLLSPKQKEIHHNIERMDNLIRTLKQTSKSQINNYYHKLIQALQKMKQNALENLNYQFQKAQRQIFSLKSSFLNHQNEIKFMKEDILPNIQLIVNEQRLPQKSFKQIISDHKQKLQEISSDLDRILRITEGTQDKHQIIVKIIDNNLMNHEIKSTLNLLERAQIVFKDRIIKAELSKNNTKDQYSFISFDINSQTKRSFSFDEENMQTSFYFPSSKKKERTTSPQVLQNYELSDSIRLSFGRQFESPRPITIQSPTFKAI